MEEKEYQTISPQYSYDVYVHHTISKLKSQESTTLFCLQPHLSPEKKKRIMDGFFLSSENAIYDPQDMAFMERQLQYVWEHQRT